MPVIKKLSTITWQITVVIRSLHQLINSSFSIAKFSYYFSSRQLLLHIFFPKVIILLLKKALRIKEINEVHQ